MGFIYRGLSLLYVFIFVWSVAILRSTDGGNITWYKPPPTETITDPTVASKTNTTLTKGSLNEELSCEFRLTADLSIITVTMMFGINTIATYASSTVLVDPRFESRGNATWIPTKLKLIVFNVTASDEGLYSCKVLTASGSWIREIQVTVLDQASITFISANQTVVVGDLLFLNCSAIGTPPARITWTRLSDDKIVDMPLTITGKQDGGGYRCTADNKVGKPVTSDVFITFHYPVEATGLGENATVRQGGKKTFSCPVDGNPKPNISWYKSSEVGQTPIFVGEELEAEVTGCYTCVASNPLGTSINIKQCLTVEESPTASSTPTSAPKGPSQTVIGVVIGVAVFVVIMIGLVTWWVWKEKKCRKHTKNGGQHYVEVTK